MYKFPHPVAPEFVHAIQENAQETVISCLQSMKAPEQVIDLIKNVWLMSIYLQECEKNSTLAQNFGMEDITIHSINLIVACGGIFQTSSGVTAPHPFTPAQVLEYEKNSAD